MISSKGYSRISWFIQKKMPRKDVEYGDETEIIKFKTENFYILTSGLKIALFKVPGWRKTKRLK